VNGILINGSKGTRRGVTLVEVLITSALSVLVAAALGSLIFMVMRIDKAVFAQQNALHQAKKAIESLNLEIRLSTTPLIVLDADGNGATEGNRVEFSRLNEAVTRSFELVSTDASIATPWDNRFIYDPDVDVDDNEIVVARGIAPVNPGGAFSYAGGSQPLIAVMRTGDWIPDDDGSLDMENQAHAATGPGLQGVEINISIAPRNPSNL
jgi:type II secretory pathway pseudopilin PulG